MMPDARIVVTFERAEPGFTRGSRYEVVAVQDSRFLLVNDQAVFMWIDVSRPTPLEVFIGAERVFDLVTFRARKKLESLTGKPVVLTTWENLGFDPDEVTDESMLVYRGVVELYDGETLFLRRLDRDQSRFGVLPRAIATIEEES